MLCFTSTDRTQRWMSLSQKSFLEQFGRLVSSEKHERREKKKYSLKETLKTYHEFQTALPSPLTKRLTDLLKLTNSPHPMNHLHLDHLTSHKSQDNTKFFKGKEKMGQLNFTNGCSAQKLAHPFLYLWFAGLLLPRQVLFHGPLK